MPMSIDEILANILRRADGVECLHFAVFLRNPPDGLPSPQGANMPALETMIGLYEWGGRNAAAEQIGLWKERIAETAQSFQELDRAARGEARAGERDRRLTRLVLDIEVGGILCAAVEDHGWVFAATLSQQSMNSGRAERQLVEIAREVRRFVQADSTGLRGGQTR
jgi:hypothetical protein